MAIGVTLGGSLVPLFAVGGDAMAGNMSLFAHPTPTTPAERLHLALSVGILVAGLVESLSARQARYKPFVLAGIAAGCWGVYLLIETNSWKSGDEFLHFLLQWFPMLALLVWLAVSVADVAQSVRHREYRSLVWRWAVAAGVGLVAGAGCYAAAGDDYAVLFLAFGAAMLWGLGLLALSIVLLTRWWQRPQTLI